jgi:hypothetical protein
MSHVKGYWMWYVSQVREMMTREVMSWEMRFIMDRYGTGVSVDDCVAQMPLEAPPEPVEKRSVFREGSVPKERKPRAKRA